MPVATRTPEQTEQSMEALAIGNRIRIHRAEIKRDLNAGRQNLLPLLLDPPDAIANALLTEILCSLPKFGPYRVGNVMHDARIGSSRRVGNLTERERGALLLRLREYGVR